MTPHLNASDAGRGTRHEASSVIIIDNEPTLNGWLSLSLLWSEAYIDIQQDAALSGDSIPGGADL